MSTRVRGRKRPNVNVCFLRDPIRISLWYSDKTSFHDIKSPNYLVFIIRVLIIFKGYHPFKSLINVIK